MELTRQRDEKNNRNGQYIVKSHRNIFRTIIGLIFSGIMWLYMLIVVAFFVSALLNYNNDQLRVLKAVLKMTNGEIRNLIFFSILCFGISYMVLLLWKLYNKKRFGKLNRRKMPEPTTDLEMLSLNLVEPQMYQELQTQKVIVLEKSPISELYEEREG